MDPIPQNHVNKDTFIREIDESIAQLHNLRNVALKIFKEFELTDEDNRYNLGQQYKNIPHRLLRRSETLRGDFKLISQFCSDDERAPSDLYELFTVLKLGHQKQEMVDQLIARRQNLEEKQFEQLAILDSKNSSLEARVEAAVACLNSDPVINLLPHESLKCYKTLIDSDDKLTGFWIKESLKIMAMFEK